MISRLSVLGSLFSFMMQGSRKFWLMPLVIALMFVMILMLVSVAMPVVAPFIYPLF
ncbi:MAG TPA: DUF5989 family protein [Chloroflexia bacterium]|nr:DUF5989 family protein [Chloroflexia bacterium]